MDSSANDVIDSVLHFGENRATYYVILGVSVIIVLIIIIMIWIAYVVLWYINDSVTIWLPVGITAGLTIAAAGIAWWAYPKTSIDWSKASAMLTSIENAGIAQLGKLAESVTT